MTDIEKRVTRYMDGIMNGTVTTGQYIRLAVKRHYDDLKQADKMGWTFNKSAAIYTIRFFPFMSHGKGEFEGKPFDPSNWQLMILWIIFGWYNKDKTRRFNYCYIEVAKKNGKTTFMAGLGNYMLIADGEAGAEVYSMATSYKQAKLCFVEAQRMIRKSEHLRNKVEVYEHNMHILETGSKFEPLSSQYESNEGINPHCSIIDEYHVHKKSTLFDLAKSAVGSRRNPLLMVITTAGFDKSLPCYALREQIIEILMGIKRQDNMTGFIYTMDPEDDWQDPANWVKSAPNLGVSVSLKFMQTEFIDAMNKGGHRLVNFQTKNLNIWVDSEDTWIPDHIWMECSDPINENELIGRKVYLGLDLSEKYDITALCRSFPPVKKGEKRKVLWDLWIPEAKVKELQDFVDYRLWAEEGLVHICEGNTVDDDLIIEQIMKYVEYHEIKELGFDEWNAKKFIVDLVKRGFPLDKCRKVVQYMSVLSEPTKKLYGEIYEQQLTHGGHKVLRWMNRNVRIKRDTNLNIRIDKDKSREKVDGMSSLVNALACEIDNNEDLINEIYKDRGL
jgi:phage terminase large subunit-like protein